MSAEAALPFYIDQTTIVSSPTHSAALYGNQLYMWGTNVRGQIPDTSVKSTAKPMLMTGPLTTTVKAVAVTEEQTLLVSNNFGLYGFGIEPVTGEKYKSEGEIIAYNVTQVSATDSFAVFLKQDGTVWTMGKNEKGQLGYGGTQDLRYPIKVNVSGIAKVAAGKDFALALGRDGTLYGWGNNSSWQLGLSNEVTEPPKDPEDDPVVVGYVRDQDTLTPKVITTNVKDIAAGEAHSLILKNDNILWSCGDNSLGQLGRSLTISATDNCDLLSIIMRDVTRISAGRNHNVITSKNDVQLTWGSNMQGQLGLENVTSLSTPTAIQQNFVCVIPTYDCSFAYSENDTIWSYGQSQNNITGKNDGRTSSVPSEVFDYYFQYKFMSFGNKDRYWSLHPTEPMNGIAKTFVGGYEDGNFYPHRSITRAEFLKFAVEALTIYDSKTYYTPTTFTDVNEDKWYANIISFAQEYGITSGYEDGTFHPESSISRAEAAVFISNIISAPSGKKSFADVPSNWMKAPISSLATLGVLNGYSDGSFRPDNDITRAEAVKVVASAAGFSPSAPERKEIAAGYKVPFSDVTSSSWYLSYLLRGTGALI